MTATAAAAAAAANSVSTNSASATATATPTTVALAPAPPVTSGRETNDELSLNKIVQAGLNTMADVVASTPAPAMPVTAIAPAPTAVAAAATAAAAMSLSPDTMCDETEYDSIFEALGIVASIKRTQKLWTSVQNMPSGNASTNGNSGTSSGNSIAGIKVNINASESSLFNSFSRWYRQDRIKNIDDLKRLFQTAFQLVDKELTKRENWIKYLRSQKIVLPLEHLSTVEETVTPMASAAPAPATPVTPATSAAVAVPATPATTSTPDVKTTLAATGIADLISAKSTINEKLTQAQLKCIIGNTLTLKRIKSALKKSRAGLDELNCNSDYSNDPNVTAAIKCLQEFIDLKFKQMESLLSYL